MLGDRPREAQAIERAGSPADLVEDHQASVGGVVQDVGGLGHFDHERGLAGVKLVAGADAREQAIDQADRRAFGRHVAAHLGQQGDQRDLADVGAFAGHVGAGDEAERIVGAKVGVVGDELAAELLLEDGMAAVDDLQHAVIDDGRAGSSAARRRGTRSRRARRRGPGRAPVPETSGGGASSAWRTFSKSVCSSAIARSCARQRLVLKFLQFFGDIALGVFDRLLARPGGRDFAAMGVGHLDVVAEHLVEPDVQGIDLRLGGELRLVFGEPLLAVGGRCREGGRAPHRSRRRSRLLRADAAPGRA